MEERGGAVYVSLLCGLVVRFLLRPEQGDNHGVVFAHG